jgi:hypothetical protein
MPTRARELSTPIPKVSFAADFARGLRERPKRVSPKYFYDDAGSALFDRICDLDEYYLTRTELWIEHVDEPADRCAQQFPGRAHDVQGIRISSRGRGQHIFSRLCASRSASERVCASSSSAAGAETRRVLSSTR